MLAPVTLVARGTLLLVLLVLLIVMLLVAVVVLLLLWGLPASPMLLVEVLLALAGSKQDSRGCGHGGGGGRGLVDRVPGRERQGRIVPASAVIKDFFGFGLNNLLLLEIERRC